MMEILRDIENVLCYLDDVLVHAPDKESHDIILRQVLDRISSAGLTLNEKCIFGVTSVPFLGYEITHRGVKPTEDNVAALLKLPAPENLTQLRAFLGMSGFYLRCVKDYAVIVEPLRRLLREGVEFVWGELQQHAFDQVKSRIQNAEPLAIFSAHLPTVVTTDASNYGIGAVLAQVHEGKLRPVAFASATLSDTQRRYSTGDKEALACLWAVEKWGVYLWGRQFKLVTDHSALVSLLGKSDSTRRSLRVARWSERLSNFNFTVEYKRGSENVVADALSRMPLKDCFAEIVDNDDEIIVGMISEVVEPFRFEEVRLATSNDANLSKVIDAIRSKNFKHQLIGDLLPFQAVSEELSSVQGVLTRGEKVVLPEKLKLRAIQAAHMGHAGISRTLQMLRKCYWWPKMSEDVETFVKACAVCIQHEKSWTVRKPTVQPIEWPTEPWSKVGIDISGPHYNLPIDMRYALVMLDYHSRWPVVSFVPQVSSGTVIKFLKKSFMEEGLPKELVSDNGPQFVSREFTRFLTERGVKHRRTAVYNPQCNGLVERFNRVLGGFIRTALLSGSQDKKESIEQQLFTYRNTPHPLTGVSPALLLKGRELRSTLDIIDFPEKRRLSPAVVSIKQRVALSQQKMVTDRPLRPIRVGDLVRIRRPGIVGKDVPRLSPPLRVVEKIGPGSFRTSDGRVWNSRRIAVHDSLSARTEAAVVQQRPSRVAIAWTPGPTISPGNSAPFRQVPGVSHNSSSVVSSQANSPRQSDIVSPASQERRLARSGIPTPTFRSTPIQSTRYPSRVRKPPKIFSSFLPW